MLPVAAKCSWVSAIPWAGEVRAHVRGSHVAAAAHMAEEGDEGAAHAVAGDSLVLGLLACEVKVLLEALHEPPQRRTPIVTRDRRPWMMPAAVGCSWVSAVAWTRL